MNNTVKYATVTDYDALYGVGYFAHQPEVSSFQQQTVPQIIAEFCSNAGIDGVVDIGAGNGVLGSILRRNGLKCIDVDVVHREDEHFIRCDFSSNDAEAISLIKARCKADFESNVLITSFDMAEHVDPEHIPDFVYNLTEIIQNEAIISISTRPSSRANIYHSTILPIETWKYMFSLVGIKATSFDLLQAHRSDQQFRSDSQELLAVSVWQKRNAFLEDPSHQHYLRLTRTTAALSSRQSVRKRIEAVLDTSVRAAKRTLLAGRQMPRLIYFISFVQDWSFLRSFLEIWPAAQVCVMLRRDFMVTAYADVIEAYLTRVGVAFRPVTSVRKATEALEEWNTGKGDLFLTATEGLPTLLHGMASLVTLNARKRGMTTVTLQHGSLVPDRTVQAAQFFVAMNEESLSDFQRSTVSSIMCTPVALGAPKHFDSMMVPADPDAIAFRLRASAKHYRLRLLVGTNLHWLAHDRQESGFADWLARTARHNPDVLFLLRPHPDDWHMTGGSSQMDLPNVLVLDEITLLCIDWPMTRVLSAIDGVISTHSTLVLDGLAAGKPTAIFPTGITDEHLLDVERAWKERGAVELSDDEISRGVLPKNWLECYSADVFARPAGYVDFLSGLLALLDRHDDAEAIATATWEVERSFLESCRDLCLDAHPHANRQAVSVAIEQFACR